MLGNTRMVQKTLVRMSTEVRWGNRRQKNVVCLHRYLNRVHGGLVLFCCFSCYYDRDYYLTSLSRWRPILEHCSSYQGHFSEHCAASSFLWHLLARLLDQQPNEKYQNPKVQQFQQSPSLGLFVLNSTSQYRLLWHKLPELHNSMLIRPCQQRIIIRTLVFRAPPWTSFRFPLETGICGTHDGLAEVVEAVCWVVSDFLG
jgi:hypothetical protein